MEWERSQNGDPELWKSVRFVVFVNHPQKMLYGSNISARMLHEIYLTLAARLAGDDIKEKFYQTVHKPGTYGRTFKLAV